MRARIISAAAILVASIGLAIAQVNFNFTVGSSSPPTPPPPPNGCSSITPPSGWSCVTNWTVTFDNQTVGQRFDWSTQHATFNDPSINLWINGNYVYSNNAACATYNGTTDGPQTSPCSPAPTVAAQIVADGKSGNGLQVLADNGLCGYNVNGFGTPSFDLGFGVAYNVIDVEWDEMWRPGFDLHSEGKIGLLVTFKDPSLPIWYGMQNMFYKDVSGSTNK